MGVLMVLIVASVVVAAIFLVVFLWATFSGQYDDLETPALRILLPDRAARHRQPADLEPHPALRDNGRTPDTTRSNLSTTKDEYGTNH